MTAESKHILIAEDDDDDFLIFSSIVQELNHNVELSRAADGNLLIKFLDAVIPDILFLDVLLPYKDGRQCIREIRSNRRYDELPVVTYSSIRTVDTVEFFYREGANLYVFKPSSFAELKGILQQILSIDWKKALYYPPKNQFVINPEA
jgi:CheY-like chemotaxis protein